jgi:hypothetical protein
MQKTMFAPPKLMLCNVFAKLKEIGLMTGNSVRVAVYCVAVLDGFSVSGYE